MAKKKIDINNAAKTITMYQRAFEKLTPEEEVKVAKYQDAGYELIIKDNPAPKGAKKDKTTAEDIRKELAKDTAALKKFEDLLKIKKVGNKQVGGFFAAKSWYQNEYKAK